MKSWLSPSKGQSQNNNLPKEYFQQIQTTTYEPEKYNYVACTFEKLNQQIVFCFMFNKKTQEDSIGYFPMGNNFREFPEQKNLRFEQMIDFIHIKEIQILELTKLKISFHSKIKEWNLIFQHVTLCKMVADCLTSILLQMESTRDQSGIWLEESGEHEIDQALGSSDDYERIQKSVRNINRFDLIKLILGKEQYFKELIKKNQQFHAKQMKNLRLQLEAQFNKQKDQMKQNFNKQIIKQLDTVQAENNGKLKSIEQKCEQKLSTLELNNKEYIRKLNEEVNLRFTKLKEEQTQRKEKILNDYNKMRDSLLEVQIQTERIEKQLQQMMKSYKTKEQSFKHDSEIKEQQIKQLHEKVNQTSKIKMINLFENAAFQDEINEKSYLCEQIEKFTNRFVKSTKLLCFLDPLNKTNVHKYIDGVPNICMVIRTVQSHLLAGFSIQPFSKQAPVIGGGILISMSKRKVYHCRQNKRAITYDDFYIIFGNSQIRVRTGQTELFSNLGISTSFYDNRGDKVNELIGPCPDRTAKIVNYELYQIIFE